MTQEQFHDLQQLGHDMQKLSQSIIKFCDATENFCHIKMNVEKLAKRFRQNSPTMSDESIRNMIFELEESFKEDAQAGFEEMRKNAYSLGWNFDHKDVNIELSGIIRKTYPSLKDINV